MKSILRVVSSNQAVNFVVYSHESQQALEFFKSALGHQTNVVVVDVVETFAGRLIEGVASDSAVLISSLLNFDAPPRPKLETCEHAVIRETCSRCNPRSSHAVELLKRYDDVYQYVERNPDITPREVARALSLHVHDAGALLVRLENEGKLYRPRDRRHYAPVPATGVVKTFQKK